MNKQDRKQLQQAIDFLNSAKDTLEFVAGAEREKFDNVPENLQGSEKFAALEHVADELDIRISELEDIVIGIEELFNQQY
jgi:hypothetical protein